jgi:transcriptional regulator with XRE-family HTH domain
MLMPPDKLLKRALILPLSPAHQFSVVSGARGLRNTASPGLRRGRRLQVPCFWDACHGFLVTVSISGLPGLAPLVSLCPLGIFPLLLCLPLRHNAFMIIGDRLRALREEKKLSQGDIEKRTGLLRCYISRVENGHTVPAIETLEKLARALEVPLYQLFYDGEEPPQLPNLPKRKSSDDIAWGSVGKEARFLNKLRRLLSKAEEGDRKLILYMAQKMANR